MVSGGKTIKHDKQVVTDTRQGARNTALSASDQLPRLDNASILQQFRLSRVARGGKEVMTKVMLDRG